MGVVLRQAWSESQWTVLTGHLTISTNVRRYQTHHRWHYFSFRKTAHSPTAAELSNNTAFEWKMWFLCFTFCQVKERKEKEEYLYSTILVRTHALKALRHGSHSFTCKLHHACRSTSYLRWHSKASLDCLLYR